MYNHKVGISDINCYDERIEPRQKEVCAYERNQVSKADQNDRILGGVTLKGRLPVILAVTLALVLPMAASAAGGQLPEREVDQARRIGQAWVERIAVTDPELSEWQGAHLTSPQSYYNPKGEIIAYLYVCHRKEWQHSRPCSYRELGIRLPST